MFSKEIAPAVSTAHVDVADQPDVQFGSAGVGAVSSVGQRPGVLSTPVLKRFAINVASLFSLHVVNMLLPLLTVPYVVRIIGPERLGLLNFSQAFIAYFTLLINYGFDMAAVRTIAANRNDKEIINRVFSEVIVGKSILWVISTIIFGSITSFVPDFREHLWLHISTYIGCIGLIFFPV